MKTRQLFLLLLLLGLLLAACGGPTASQSDGADGAEDTAPVDGDSIDTSIEATQDPNQPVTSDELLPPANDSEADVVATGKASVAEIDILILESFPVQVMIVTSGSLPDGCTTISHTEQANLDNNQIMLEVFTQRPADATCTDALVPFEENFSLDVYGLPAGDYTVDVNGITGTFNLAIDNLLQDGGDTDASDNTSGNVVVSDDDSITIDLPPVPGGGEKDTIVGQAVIDSFDLLQLESYPVQYSVSVEGNLPDGCTSISHAEQANLDDNQIVLTVYTQRPAGAMCTMALVPFAEVFPLDVSELPSGEYTLTVNGISTVFTIDNG